MFDVYYQKVIRKKRGRIVKFELKLAEAGLPWEEARETQAQLAKDKSIHAAVICKSGEDMEHLHTFLL